MRKTAIVVWDDDYSDCEYDAQEFAAALHNAAEDNKVFFFLATPGVTDAAQAAGADPTVWDVPDCDHPGPDCPDHEGRCD